MKFKYLLSVVIIFFVIISLVLIAIWTGPVYDSFPRGISYSITSADQNQDGLIDTINVLLGNIYVGTESIIKIGMQDKLSSWNINHAGVMYPQFLPLSISGGSSKTIQISSNSNITQLESIDFIIIDIYVERTGLTTPFLQINELIPLSTY